MINSSESKSNKIDTLVFQKWFHRFVSHWHLFLISIGIAAIGSYFFIKYTTPLYSVMGSVLVKDASSNINPFKSEGFDYGSYARNINLTNEIKIFSSKRLIEETLKNIDWQVSYYIEGKVRTSQLYKFKNFKVSFSDSNNQIPYGLSFELREISATKYKLREMDSDSKIEKVYNYNQIYKWNKFEFKIVKSDQYFNPNVVYNFIINSKDAVIREFSSKLRINQIDKSSSVLIISSNGSDIEREIDFVNNHCNSYVKLNLYDKNATNERAINFIENQLELIADTLVKLDDKISYYRKKFSGSNIEILIEKRFLKLEVLEDEKSKYLLNDRYFQYLKSYILSKDDYLDIVVPVSVGIIDPTLTALLNQLMELKSKQNVTFKIEQSKSPFRIENENKINQVKKNILEVINNIENGNKILVDDLKNRTKKVISTTSNILDIERNYIELRRKYKINEELYNILLKKKAEMSIVRAGNVSDTKIIDLAYVTGSPYPNKAKIYITNILIALIIPLAYVLFKYITNYKIMERDDVTNVCNMPFLGTIGHIPNNDNLIIVNKPKSAFAEAFRSVRSNLSFFMSGKNDKVILITSSSSGDGKTFTSLNIASIIALSGKKTVLIGADMRKPKVYIDLNLKNAEGLSNYLINKADIEKIIKPTKMDNLYFINSGIIPPNPAELLMNNRLAELILYLRANFDYIIIDTPPIGLVSDAMNIMQYSDVNIFIVRHNYTLTRYLIELNENIQTNKIKNMTFLLNDYDVKKNYGYGYKYGYYGSKYDLNNSYSNGSYGGYYEEEEQKPKEGLFGKIVALFKRT